MMLITMSISSRVNPELRRNLNLPAISQPLFPNPIYQSLFTNPCLPILILRTVQRLVGRLAVNVEYALSTP
jgi:hypothetical protein